MQDCIWKQVQAQRNDDVQRFRDLLCSNSFLIELHFVIDRYARLEIRNLEVGKNG